MGRKGPWSSLRTEPVYDTDGNLLIGPVRQGEAIERSGVYTLDELNNRVKEDPFAQPDLEKVSSDLRRRRV